MKIPIIGSSCTSRLKKQKQNQTTNFDVLLQMISQTLFSAVWWGKDISKSMETHWCHRLPACACTHTHAGSQTDGKSACTHTCPPPHTVTIKHRLLPKTQTSAAFFICSVVFLSLFMCIFFLAVIFWHLLNTAIGKKWPLILTSQTWPMVVRFSTACGPAVGSGLVLDCVGLFGF